MTSALTAALVCVSLLSLAGCEEKDTVAATVNGVEIMESQITPRIMVTRNSSASYADDVTWANYLTIYGLTPESMRQNVLDMYTDRILINELAADNGIVADEQAVDEAIGKTRRIVGGTDSTWLDALKRGGYVSEDDYRDSRLTANLQNQLLDKLTPETPKTEVEQYVIANASQYYGKRSSMIMLKPDKSQTPEQMVALAEELLAYYEEGEDFADLAAEYSSDADSAAKGGDMGWDKVTNYSIAYRDVLRGLGLDEVSDPVNGTDGTVYLIKCTELFEAPLNSALAVSDVPEAIIGVLEEKLSDEKRSAKLTELLKEKKEAATIEVVPIPTTLPYYVDMSIATINNDSSDSSSETPSNFSASSPEAVTAALAAGLKIEDLETGGGTEATPGSTVTVYYTGTLESGEVFDSTDNTGAPYSFVLGSKTVIAGWDAGVVGMKEGGTRRLTIPASLAYGTDGVKDSDGNIKIPGSATLIFEIHLDTVVPPTNPADAATEPPVDASSGTGADTASPGSSSDGSSGSGASSSDWYAPQAGSGTEGAADDAGSGASGADGADGASGADGADGAQGASTEQTP